MTYRLSDSTTTRTTDTISAGARIRRVLERGYGGGWVAQPFGPAGVQLQHRSGVSIIVTEADSDGVEWRHASVAGRDRMPSWDELASSSSQEGTTSQSTTWRCTCGAVSTVCPAAPPLSPGGRCEDPHPKAPATRA